MKELTQVLGIVIMFCFSLTVHAQNNDLKNSTPEERAQFQTEWMESELSLDSTVVPTVYDINLKYANKMESIKNSGGRRYQKFQQMKSLSEDKDNELKKIFTKEQYNTYLARKNEAREEIKQRMRENR